MQANVEFKKLPLEFYSQPTLELAQTLLGKILIHHLNGYTLSGKIVETEAYLTPHDEACHAYKGKTPRNAHMFGHPGTLYVYFTYGNHFMLNIVSEPEGVAAAVLIRALEPFRGQSHMKAHRNTEKTKNLTNGPGKLTQALQINKSHSGLSLQSNTIYLCEPEKIAPFEIECSTRVGITRSTALPWRFYIYGNPHVSKGKPS